MDLGDLDVVFLRNVPPEPFNYTQRVGRAGRRDRPGLALTYCRRNPHDLYHYADPEGRVIAGRVQPPRLRMRNEKIILRHMVSGHTDSGGSASDCSMSVVCWFGRTATGERRSDDVHGGQV